jgi:hypothetical protein
MTRQKLTTSPSHVLGLHSARLHCSLRDNESRHITVVMLAGNDGEIYYGPRVFILDAWESWMPTDQGEQRTAFKKT